MNDQSKGNAEADQPQLSKHQGQIHPHHITPKGANLIQSNLSTETSHDAGDLLPCDPYISLDNVLKELHEEQASCLHRTDDNLDPGELATVDTQKYLSLCMPETCIGNYLGGSFSIKI